MNIKKHRGHVYGAVLSKAEQKAMEIEINRQIVESEKKHMDDIDIIVLYVLHTRFGFGKSRLRKFYDAFREEYQSLVDYYQMPDDSEWLAEYKLKADGIDVREWNRETEMKEDKI